MGRIGVAVVMGVAVAACGDNVRIDVIGTQPGSILVPRGYDVGGGTGILRAWYDTHEGVECSFSLADDGRYRCLPTGDEVAVADSITFLDGQCMVPGALLAPCASPRFVRVEGVSTSTCSAPEAVSVYTLGASHAFDYYYRYNAAHQCVRVDITDSSVLYELGTRVDASRFVRARLQVQPAAGVLAPYAFVADDGTVEMTGTWDTARDGECSARLRDTEPRCQPDELAYHDDTLWDDASCTRHVAADYSYVRPCAAPTAGMLYSNNQEHFFELRNRVSSAYSTSGGTCAAQPANGARYYVEGPAISDDAFPPMRRSLDGTGRIRVLRFADADNGVVTRGVALYDTKLQETCHVRPLADGTNVCVDAGEIAALSDHAGYYADDACKIPLVAMGHDATPTIVLVAPPQSRRGCAGNTYEVREVGALYEGPIFSGPNCTTDERSPFLSYWQLGAKATGLPTLRHF